MKAGTNLFGEKVPQYESKEEESAAIRAYVNGEYRKLTALEVLFFRKVEEQTSEEKFNAAHAGMRAENVADLDINGVIFGSRPLTEPIEVGKRLLFEAIGERPITFATLIDAEAKLLADQYRVNK